MVEGWLKLCSLCQTYVPLSFDKLQVSDDNMLLVAFDIYGAIVQWQLMDDEIEPGATATRINGHDIRSAIMTGDHKYMAAVTVNSMKLWNLKTDRVQ